MLKHHSGSQMAPDYKVELVRSFRKPMERQIFEGMRIRNSKAIPINRKGEWGQNLPPRFEIEETKKPRFRVGGQLTQTREQTIMRILYSTVKEKVQYTTVQREYVQIQYMTLTQYTSQQA